LLLKIALIVIKFSIFEHLTKSWIFGATIS